MLKSFPVSPDTGYIAIKTKHKLYIKKNPEKQNTIVHNERLSLRDIISLTINTISTSVILLVLLLHPVLLITVVVI
jgi:hypothetical protein